VVEAARRGEDGLWTGQGYGAEPRARVAAVTSLIKRRDGFRSVARQQIPKRFSPGRFNARTFDRALASDRGSVFGRSPPDLGHGFESPV